MVELICEGNEEPVGRMDPGRKHTVYFVPRDDPEFPYDLRHCINGDIMSNLIFDDEGDGPVLSETDRPFLLPYKLAQSFTPIVLAFLKEKGFEPC